MRDQDQRFEYLPYQSRIRQQCPVRNQTPSHEAKDAYWLGGVLADRWDALGGSDVPARLPGWVFLKTEVVLQVTFFGRKPIAPAHGE